jgi:hypothetical protein
VVVCLLAGERPASAQKDSVFVAGASFSLYRSNDESVQSPWGIGLLARLRRQSGLGGTMGLNWIRATLESEGDNGQTIGQIVVRPLMFGPVFTRQFARFAVSGSFVAGYSFNGLRKMQGAANYNVSDSFVCRPSVSIWFELGNRWGLMTSLSYLFNRPELTTTTAAGTSRRTIDLNAPVVTFGLGYGVF